MTEEKFIEEIVNEVRRIQEEMEFVEKEYDNYIRELQHMNNNKNEFKEETRDEY